MKSHMKSHKNPIKSTCSIVIPSFHLHPQKTLRGQPAPPALGAASSAAATAGAAPRAPRRGPRRRRRSVAGAAGAERGAVAGGEGRKVDFPWGFSQVDHDLLNT